MKIWINLFVLTLLFQLSTQAQFNTVKSCLVSFKIKNAGINVDGKFTSVIAKINIDEKDISKSSFQGTVKSNSVETGIKLRNDHLKDKEEFFNAAKFPEIVMKSTKITQTSIAGTYKVDWLITIKGISKTLSSDVIIKKQAGSILAYSTMKVNRRNLNIGGKSITMSDSVTLTLNAIITP